LHRSCRAGPEAAQSAQDAEAATNSVGAGAQSRSQRRRRTCWVCSNPIRQLWRNQQYCRGVRGINAGRERNDGRPGALWLRRRTALIAAAAPAALLESQQENSKNPHFQGEKAWYGSCADTDPRPLSCCRSGVIETQGNVCLELKSGAC
jgi:hypothetical protein